MTCDVGPYLRPVHHAQSSGPPTRERRIRRRPLKRSWQACVPISHSRLPLERPPRLTKLLPSRCGQCRARRWSIPCGVLLNALSAMPRPPPVSLARTYSEGRWLERLVPGRLELLMIAISMLIGHRSSAYAAAKPRVRIKKGPSIQMMPRPFPRLRDVYPVRGAAASLHEWPLSDWRR